jgi:hypothetical protein
MHRNILCFVATVFLLSCNTYRRTDFSELLETLDGVLGNLGPSLIDNFDARRSERRRRLKALESISDVHLREVRDERIGVLKSED